ncbi:hypothetical protein EXE58_12055 [Nocardioides seonyuensis]|uniref:Uncharacterized protein n=1 Tax=Nocardioides seonyuensis TaxID=2518371 RepID=A0A4P7IFS9_9ACTN|nr:hypothetical protein [Nocardioides seonyuensis]QBX56125.1 hypothetical protein EXE58_12055 [Nocardioides seonyuensis]
MDDTTATPATATPTTVTPRRARHLMDPDAPRPARDQAREDRSLSRVQRWVMSVLAVTTIGHLAGGIVLAALTIDDPQPGARVGLCVIAGAFGVLAVVVGLAIHGRRLLSPWLLVGLLPTVVGLLLLQR